MYRPYGTLGDSSEEEARAGRVESGRSIVRLGDLVCLRMEKVGLVGDGRRNGFRRWNISDIVSEGGGLKCEVGSGKWEVNVKWESELRM